ncbi:N,N-dimethylformamidase beta subunit family domain-containing protein [Amycolatopsis jejuensis]|uniref:N,N-dimethylformamidase beta subunit family domain-containing protein n=1 Tax=Amycolatopsis jejuensis TaxID=330084 RepID=UPI000525DCD6|nr:N,N-dimethylformamidase beta subunit family domain-containing protein [Amycolatopsis jejuensis]
MSSAIYLDAMSVAPGDPLIAHAATRLSVPLSVDIYHVVGTRDCRYEPRLDFVLRVPYDCPTRYSPQASDRMGPGDADVSGCGWPSRTLLPEIPADWPSGIYLAQLTESPEPTGKASPDCGQDALFIVRPPAPRRPILWQVNVATWNAYHIWQNRNLYIGYAGDDTGHTVKELRAHTVSFHRPGIGLAPRSNIPHFPPTAFMYNLAFIEWLRSEGLEVDFCTGADLHSGAVDLAGYQLLLSVGHDEYWSRAQRDAVENFVRQGGNAAFFGGNICFWQIRYASDLTSLSCYKRGADITPGRGDGEPLDPLYADPSAYPDHDNSDVTVEYWSAPLDRNTTSLTGVSMQHLSGAAPSGTAGEPSGAAWWWENFGGPPRPARGFRVAVPDHWAFAGTGLKMDEEFGAEQKVVGFECDGLDVAWHDGVPVPTHRDGAPADLRILAYADCRDWTDLDYSNSPPRRSAGNPNKAASGGIVPIVTFTSGRGTVFTAPSTDWVHALTALADYTDDGKPPRIPGPSSDVRTITRNVLTTLARGEPR